MKELTGLSAEFSKCPLCDCNKVSKNGICYFCGFDLSLWKIANSYYEPEYVSEKMFPAHKGVSTFMYE